MESQEIESPGKYLKAKRESKRISLREVAGTTRIREAVLRAIEEDRYKELPNLYVKSFLNAYAKSLGLDTNDVIMLHQKYEKNLPFSENYKVRPPSTSLTRRRMVWWSAVSISAAFLIALILYLSFRFLHYRLSFF